MPHFFPEEAAFFETEGRLFGRFPFSSSDDSKNTTRHNARSVVPSSLDCAILREQFLSFEEGRSRSKHTHTPTSLSD
jgi:hypothetical protein